MQKLRSLALPIAIVLGFCFSDFLTSFSVIVPYLVAAMLYFSCAKVDVKQCKMSPLFLYLMLFQVVMSIVFYVLFHFFEEDLAQGMLITVLAPTATAAVVIAVMLGANINTMLTYTLLCNLCVAILAPIYFVIINPNAGLSFVDSCLAIFTKVFFILIFPLLLALLTKKILPKINVFLARNGQISFYLWAISLTVVIAKTIHFIRTHASDVRIIFYMSLAAGGLCAIQFLTGRYLGKKYHDITAGGQALGQKNTVLAIYLAQTYLTPLACVVPAMYVIWQNVFNSYQIWRKNG